MKSKTTLIEIYKWLSEGKKIKRSIYGDKEFIHIKNNTLVDENSIEVISSFVYPSEWELYQEPEEKVKWFKIISFPKSADQPYISSHLFTSKEHFLKYGSNKENDYHFIILEEVKYE